LVKMRAAKKALEQEAAERAAEAARDKAARAGLDTNDTAVVVDEAVAAAVVNPRAQKSFTDPEARMMKNGNGTGFGYAYNAQAAADEHSQVIVGVAVTQAPTDVNQLMAMLAVIIAGLEAAGIKGRPRTVLADAGYCSTQNIDDAADAGHDLHVATGRLKHHEKVPDAPKGRIPKAATSRERMARKLRTKTGKAHYARRKAIIEPVFGQMKVRQNAGLLRLRGLDGAKGEFTLHALCHNLRKLNNYQRLTAC